MNTLRLFRDAILILLAGIFLIVLILVAGLQDVHAAPIRAHYSCPPAGVMRICYSLPEWQAVRR